MSHQEKETVLELDMGRYGCTEMGVYNGEKKLNRAGNQKSTLYWGRVPEMEAALILSFFLDGYLSWLKCPVVPRRWGKQNP